MNRFTAHLGTLFPELAPLERPAAARAAGFTVVEAWWPPAPEPDEWIAAVTAAGVTAELVNADGGDLAAGERGYCTVPGREGDVLRAVCDAARVVLACGGDLVNLLVGHLDPARDAAFQHDLAVETVRAAGDEAAVLGARIVIEHLNPIDVAGPLLPTPAAAAAFVTEVAHPSVHLLFDAYHAARAGLDPLAEVEPVADLIAPRAVRRQPRAGCAGHRDDRPLGPAGAPRRHRLRGARGAGVRAGRTHRGVVRVPGGPLGLNGGPPQPRQPP